MSLIPSWATRFRVHSAATPLPSFVFICGLVTLQVDGLAMAGKPNLDSLLRCRWAHDARFGLPFVLRIASGVAGALWYLHSHGIAHGDVYAHNILVDEHGSAVLCDYGGRALA